MQGALAVALAALCAFPGPISRAPIPGTSTGRGLHHACMMVMGWGFGALAPAPQRGLGQSPSGVRDREPRDCRVAAAYGDGSE